MEVSSEHHLSQTGRAEELKFLDKVHLPPLVMCRVSSVMYCVTCQVSRVMCHMSHVTYHISHNFLLLYNVVKQVGGGSVINGATLLVSYCLFVCLCVCEFILTIICVIYYGINKKNCGICEYDHI